MVGYSVGHLGGIGLCVDNARETPSARYPAILAGIVMDIAGLGRYNDRTLVF